MLNPEKRAVAFNRLRAPERRIPQTFCESRDGADETRRGRTLGDRVRVVRGAAGSGKARLLVEATSEPSYESAAPYCGWVARGKESQALAAAVGWDRPVEGRRERAPVWGALCGAGRRITSGQVLVYAVGITAHQGRDVSSLGDEAAVSSRNGSGVSVVAALVSP
ncbi:hypothetical protein [Streptomyces sp. NPDC052721]|uniref:hypothetical protein n=1 Tax=Streptomyces sp. NPDC052721 TaxID=3154955 RepID=UPI0034332B17